MSLLVYVEASPLKGRSNSTAVAEAFLEAYQASHPSDDIVRLDLWHMDLPPFDAETIDAKFAVLRKQQFTPRQWQRWDAVRSVSRRFNAGDKYVFSVPMWNFGVPYPLKHFIDIVTLPGENWTWSKERGYEPLLSGKSALLIYSSANDYSGHDDRSDFQKPYLRRWLEFIGVHDIQEVTVAPTLADPAAVADRRGAAIQQVRRLAPAF
ncbi:MAG TPA: NAD(P)H-dependent oxidoreductase [Steroidobacter sp.]